MEDLEDYDSIVYPCFVYLKGGRAEGLLLLLAVGNFPYFPVYSSHILVSWTWKKSSEL